MNTFITVIVVIQGRELLFGRPGWLIVFVVAVIVRYIWLAWQALRGVAPEEFDPTKASSGV